MEPISLTTLALFGAFLCFQVLSPCAVVWLILESGRKKKISTDLSYLMSFIVALLLLIGFGVAGYYFIDHMLWG